VLPLAVVTFKDPRRMNFRRKMSSNRSTAASAPHQAPFAQRAANAAQSRFLRRFPPPNQPSALRVSLIAVIKTKSSSTSNAAKVCLSAARLALAFADLGQV
jgi:hypothetical protein